MERAWTSNVTASYFRFWVALAHNAQDATHMLHTYKNRYVSSTGFSIAVIRLVTYLDPQTWTKLHSQSRLLLALGTTLPTKHHLCRSCGRKIPCTHSNRSARNSRNIKQRHPPLVVLWSRDGGNSDLHHRNWFNIEIALSEDLEQGFSIRGTQANFLQKCKLTEWSVY